MITQNLKAHYRLDREIEKFLERDNLDYKGLSSLINSRNSIEKAIVLWLDRLEFKESSSLGIAQILKELDIE